MKPRKHQAETLDRMPPEYKPATSAGEVSWAGTFRVAVPTVTLLSTAVVRRLLSSENVIKYHSP